MQRAMSSRAACTADGDQPGYKYLHDAAVGKVRRTRRAPDFYSPEMVSKSYGRSKKTNSDDNDSWKPESDSDSDFDGDHLNGRQKPGVRRKPFSQKTASDDEVEEEEEDDQTEMVTLRQKPKGKNSAMSESDAEEKSPKEKKETKQKEKKMKGCRELQDLLDGCAQVHKESRTRRLAPRHRTMHNAGLSESTWSNSSSRMVTDKDSGNQHTDSKKQQNSSKQMSSLTSSSAQDAHKTNDSSTENPPVVEMSETVEEDDAKPSRRAMQSVKNDTSVSCTRQGKPTSMEVVSDSGPRVKRRLDVEMPQMRKLSKSSDNGGHETNSAGRDVREIEKEEPTVIKLPRMPMIRYGEYWYRARIKQETKESIFVEFTGFEDGLVKPFWIRKDSVDVFKGSYSGKDWRHVGEGAWEPKPRKVHQKKYPGRGGRRRRRGGMVRSTESRDHPQSNQFSRGYSDQAYTADSEKCIRSGSGALTGSGERVVYRKSSADSGKRGCLEKMRSAASIPTSMNAEHPEKNMDCGSQSDVPAKDVLSYLEHNDSHHCSPSEILEMKEEAKQNGMKTASGGSPFSRHPSGSSQQEECQNKNGDNQKDSCNMAENVEERAPRLRRKAAKPQERRQELERITSVRKQVLRRSARLCPKGSWKFKDSSSEAECDEDSPASKRNGQTSRPTMQKYITRSARNSEMGRRNSISSQMFRGPHLPPRPQTSAFAVALPNRKERKTVIRAHGMREYYEEFDELLEDEGTFSRGRDEGAIVRRVPETVDGMTMWNLEVNVLSQIRKYVPYYNDHVPDAKLSAFMELMERLDGVGMQDGSVQRHLPGHVSQLTALTPKDSMNKAAALPSISETPHPEDSQKLP